MDQLGVQLVASESRTRKLDADCAALQGQIVRTEAALRTSREEYAEQANAMAGLRDEVRHRRVSR